MEENSGVGLMEVYGFATGIFYLALLMMVLVGVSSIVHAIKKDSSSSSAVDFQSKQLHFAAVTLTGLGLIFVLAMAMYYFAPAGREAAAEAIFDACKTVLPPIITLILGFYFGQENSTKEKIKTEDISVANSGSTHNKSSNSDADGAGS